MDGGDGVSGDGGKMISFPWKMKKVIKCAKSGCEKHMLSHPRLQNGSISLFWLVWSVPVIGPQAPVTDRKTSRDHFRKLKTQLRESIDFNT